MEITGKITQLLEMQTGEGRNGQWKKQEFILETEDQYPKSVCISVWGDKIDQFNLTVGAQVTASINIESREYNGRWYTDVRAWRMDAAGAGPSAGAGAPPQAASAPVSEPLSAGDEDDLPF